jgi:hypothetical protein
MQESPDGSLVPGSDTGEQRALQHRLSMDIGPGGDVSDQQAFLAPFEGMIRVLEGHEAFLEPLQHPCLHEPPQVWEPMGLCEHDRLAPRVQQVDQVMEQSACRFVDTHDMLEIEHHHL